MDFKVAAFLFFNILFFVCVSSNKTSCGPVTPAPKTPKTPKTPAPVTPTPKTPAPVTPVPKTPAPVKPPKCPKDTLNLGGCADVLGGLGNLALGSSSSTKCCTLLKGLANNNAGLCLCTALKDNVMGLVKVDVPVAASLLVNACGLKGEDFKC